MWGKIKKFKERSEPIFVIWVYSKIFKSRDEATKSYTYKTIKNKQKLLQYYFSSVYFIMQKWDVLKHVSLILEPFKNISE